MLTLQHTTKRHTPNNLYENVVTLLLEIAAESIPTKSRAKGRILWESAAVREKRDNTKKGILT